MYRFELNQASLFLLETLFLCSLVYVLVVVTPTEQTDPGSSIRHPGRRLRELVARGAHPPGGGNLQRSPPGLGEARAGHPVKLCMRQSSSNPVCGDHGLIRYVVLHSFGHPRRRRNRGGGHRVLSFGVPSCDNQALLYEPTWYTQTSRLHCLR